MFLSDNNGCDWTEAGKVEGAGRRKIDLSKKPSRGVWALVAMNTWLARTFPRGVEISAGLPLSIASAGERSKSSAPTRSAALA